MASAVLLWSRRREIESRETRDGGEELASLSMLFAQFAPNSWWAAPVDMLRRISLSTLLLFFTPAYQLVLALLICIFFTVTQRELTPWYDPSMDLVAYATGWETIFCELRQSRNCRTERTIANATSPTTRCRGAHVQRGR